QGGTVVANSTVTDPTVAFGSGSTAIAFADTSLPDQLGILYVVHNDGPGVEIARIDVVSGGRVDASDPSVASSGGCQVNGSPVLTPPGEHGGRVLFFTLKSPNGACPADGTLVRIPILGDAASPSAAIGPASFAKLDSLTTGVG